jgi:hypothetical protein
LEPFVIFGSDLKVPLPGLKPFFFYLRHLILYAFPQERPWSFGVGMTGIALDFKVIQPV